MDARLQAYQDLSKYFLTQCSSIGDALEEARKTQEALASLIMLERELGTIAKRTNREYEHFMSDKRADIAGVASKNGVKITDKLLESMVEAKFKDTLMKIEEARDEAELDYDAAKTFRMAFLQRKAIITEYISYVKYQQDYDSCIVKNKAFMQRIMENYDITRNNTKRIE